MVRTSPETGHVLEVDTVDIPDLFTHCFIVSRDQPLWQVSARHDKGDTESRESGDGHGERASERVSVTADVTVGTWLRETSTICRA